MDPRRRVQRNGTYIHKLPNELLIKIFKYAGLISCQKELPVVLGGTEIIASCDLPSPADYQNPEARAFWLDKPRMPTIDPSNTSYPMNFIWVCQRWAYLMISSSELWTHFRVVDDGDDEVADLVEETRTFIKLSGDRPLTFSIIIETGRPAEKDRERDPYRQRIVNLLTDNAHRWKNVHICVHCPAQHPFQALFSDIVHTARLSPHLESLVVEGEGYFGSERLELPHLRSLSFTGVFPGTSSIWAPNLKVLQLQDEFDMHDIYEILSCFPNLEKLNVDGGFKTGTMTMLNHRLSSLVIRIMDKREDDYHDSLVAVTQALDFLRLPYLRECLITGVGESQHISHSFGALVLRSMQTPHWYRHQVPESPIPNGADPKVCADILSAARFCQPTAPYPNDLLSWSMYRASLNVTVGGSQQSSDSDSDMDEGEFEMDEFFWFRRSIKPMFAIRSQNYGMWISFNPILKYTYLPLPAFDKLIRSILIRDLWSPIGIERERMVLDNPSYVATRTRYPPTAQVCITSSC